MPLCRLPNSIALTPPGSGGHGAERGRCARVAVLTCELSLELRERVDEFASLEHAITLARVHGGQDLRFDKHFNGTLDGRKRTLEDARCGVHRENRHLGQVAEQR